jgi:hypothetical protein
MANTSPEHGEMLVGEIQATKVRITRPARVTKHRISDRLLKMSLFYPPDTVDLIISIIADGLLS